MVKRSENEENLLDVIEDLKSDLKARDFEFEETRERLEKLEAQNEYLRKSLLKEKESKITIEAKLNKMMAIKELDENFAVIDKGAFFEQRNNKISSLNTNLL